MSGWEDTYSSSSDDEDMLSYNIDNIPAAAVLYLSRPTSPESPPIDTCGWNDKCTNCDLEDFEDWDDDGWHGDRLKRIQAIRLKEVSAQQVEWELEQEYLRLHWKDELDVDERAYLRIERQALKASRRRLWAGNQFSANYKEIIDEPEDVASIRHQHGRWLRATDPRVRRDQAMEDEERSITHTRAVTSFIGRGLDDWERNVVLNGILNDIEAVALSNESDDTGDLDKKTLTNIIEKASPTTEAQAITAEVALMEDLSLLGIDGEAVKPETETPPGEFAAPRLSLVADKQPAPATAAVAADEEKATTPTAAAPAENNVQLPPPSPISHLSPSPPVHVTQPSSGKLPVTLAKVTTKVAQQLFPTSRKPARSVSDADRRDAAVNANRKLVTRPVAKKVEPKKVAPKVTKPTE